MPPKQQKALTRQIKIQFLANSYPGFRGDFKPHKPLVKVSLDQTSETYFIARNAINKLVKLQAISSISPSEASAYVTKFECFCFQQQELQAGQTKEMGLSFSVSKKLPDYINTITIAYALYPVVPNASTMGKNLTINHQAKKSFINLSINPSTNGEQSHEPRS